GFVALSYGLAISLSVAIFHPISAHVNPASLLADWIMNEVTGVEFVVLSLAEIAGAFTGSCLMFITYLPHFMNTQEFSEVGHHEEKVPLLQNRQFTRGHSALAISSHQSAVGQTSMLGQDARHDALVKASGTADKAAKLSSFCNRPAIPHTLFNWITEFICTFTLILVASLLRNRVGSFDDTAGQVYARGLYPLLLGFYIFTLIVCLGTNSRLTLGGPTGFSANPSRDLGPRLAHFVLPISGKGDSEWWFGLIVSTADFAGGAVAGLIVPLLKL
ncbi:hypothetical protein HDU91_003898, partial [Kappamyces sp. JEL0680]